MPVVGKSLKTSRDYLGIYKLYNKVLNISTIVKFV